MLATIGIATYLRKQREASRSIVAGHHKDEVVDNAAVNMRNEPQLTAPHAVPCKRKQCGRTFATTSEMLRHMAIDH